jgi:hypothetical protein
MELRITKHKSVFFVGSLPVSKYYKMNNKKYYVSRNWLREGEIYAESEEYRTELEAENRSFSLAAEFKKLLETEKI